MRGNAPRREEPYPLGEIPHGVLDRVWFAALADLSQPLSDAC